MNTKLMMMLKMTWMMMKMMTLMKKMMRRRYCIVLMVHLFTQLKTMTMKMTMTRMVKVIAMMMMTTTTTTMMKKTTRTLKKKKKRRILEPSTLFNHWSVLRTSKTLIILMKRMKMRMVTMLVEKLRLHQKERGLTKTLTMMTVERMMRDPPSDRAGCSWFEN